MIYEYDKNIIRGVQIYIVTLKVYRKAEVYIVAAGISRKGRFIGRWIMQTLLHGVVIGENRVTDGPRSLYSKERRTEEDGEEEARHVQMRP